MKIVAPLLMFFSVFLICIGLAVVPSCHSTVDCKNPANASSASCVTQQAVIDCTTPAAQAFVTEHLNDIAQFFTAAGVDWTAVEQALINLVVPDAICVLETVVEHYLTVTPTLDAGVGSAGSAAVPTIDSVAIRQKAAEISAKRWPGKKAKLR